MVSFKTTKSDAQLIRKIVDRATKEYADLGKNLDAMSLSMDLLATHANGCELNLQALLDADRFQFLHDIGGIQRHLDRQTGELGGCFLPRFAV